MKKKPIKIILPVMAVVICSILIGFLQRSDESDCAEQYQTVKLSQLTDDECLNFIIDNGIEIPDEFALNSDLGEFVKGIVSNVEVSPDFQFSYNYTVTRNFAEDIKALVNDYYNVSDKRVRVQENDYVLKDSTLAKSWSFDDQKFNCYGYAIDKTDYFKDPGYYSKKQFSSSLDIYDMALIVQADLKALGETGIYITDDMPRIEEWQKLICIRKGSNDYHFMKFDFDGWYHKPGGTAILRWNYSSPDYKIWSNENIIGFDNATKAPTTYYDSQIYYIVYGSYNFKTSLLSDDTLEITEFLSDDNYAMDEINIPSGIGGRKITKIGAYAFENQKASKITLPDSVTEIGERAFNNCTNLLSITIPSNVSKIGEGAFYLCTHLLSVELEKNSLLYSIERAAFASCYLLQKITIPNRVKTIGNGAFMLCYNLSEIVFEEKSNLQTIGREAFYATNILELKLPDSVTQLGDYAFMYCMYLKTVEFGDNSQLSTIGKGVFYGCINLKDIQYPRM